MAQQHLNTGSSANDGAGDTLRSAFVKTEENFTDLYTNIRGPVLPNYTGSALITGSLGTTGSIQIEGTGSFPIITLGVDPGGSVEKTGSIKLIDNSYPEVRFSRENNNSYEYLRLNLNSTEQIELFGIVGTSTNRIFFNKNSSLIRSVFKTSTNDNTLYFSSLRAGINNSSPSTELDITGEVSSSEYFATSLPTSDPNNAGQWFTTSSNEVFGDGNETPIICISQG
jgi:hypothetical protein